MKDPALLAEALAIAVMALDRILADAGEWSREGDAAAGALKEIRWLERKEQHAPLQTAARGGSGS